MRLITALLLLTSLSAAGQTLPDSIVITKKAYVNSFTEDGDNLYGTERFLVLLKGNHYALNNERIAKSKIVDFLSATNNPSNTNNSLLKYRLDTSWIKNNASY